MKTTLLALLLFLLHAPAFAGTITLATHELFPYGYYNATNEFTGYAVERVRSAVHRCGHELKLVVVPWARAQALAKNGAVDGFFAASMNDERKALYEASTTLAPQTWAWFMLKDAPLDPQSPEFKQEALVSSFIGANMQKYLQENGYRTAEAPKDTESLFKMLMLGRLDAILANCMVAKNIMEKEGLRENIRARKLRSEPLYAMFTKKFIENNPGFLDCFNSALKTSEEACETTGN